jgi:hypothetical protein
LLSASRNPCNRTDFGLQLMARNREIDIGNSLGLTYLRQLSKH